MQHVTGRNDQAARRAEPVRHAESCLDDIVADKLIEDLAASGDHRPRLPGIERMQGRDLEAVVALRQRVGVALRIEITREIEQKSERDW